MRKIFSIVFVVVLSCFGHAQQNPYVFNHLTSKEGLSQSSVIAIHQDKLGQIWMGTRDGLNKYDGTKITVYRSEPDNPKTISNNDILAIQEDAEGYLWIGTYNGLNKYNPKTNMFTRYFHAQDDNSLSNNVVWTLKVLSNDNICIGTKEGLSIYDKTTNTFTNYLNKVELGEEVGVHITSILEAQNGALYLGTPKNVLRSKTVLNPQFEVVNTQESLYIQDLIEANNNVILIATQTKGILALTPQTKTYTPYVLKNAEVMDNKNVRRLLFSADDKLWAGTYNGLFVIDKKRHVLALKSDLDTKNSLSKNSIKSLFKDNKGTIWIGTYYGGVNIWDKSNGNFRTLSENRKGKGLNYNVVSSIATYRNSVFFGTEGGGLNLLNKNTGNYSYLHTGNSKIKDDNIKALMRSHKDELWIGTFKNGIELYDLKTGILKTETLPDTLIQCLKATGVYAIKEDVSSHTIWIGTFGKGVLKYDTITQNIEIFQYSETKTNALSSNLIRAICIDSKHNVWVGTEKGLNKITTSGAISHFFYNKAVQYGDDILTVYEDQANTIWVGTKSKGLYVYNRDAFKAVNLALKAAQVPVVNSILEDNKQCLWMGTNLGILKFDTRQKHTKLFNQKEGLIGNEFNNNACLKIGAAKFYFGGPLGVTYFDVNKLKTNTHVPAVILTDFAIKNSELKESTSPKLKGLSLPFTKAIDLDYNQGNFSISFAIPSYINSSNNSYKYRLKGLENEWNVTSTGLAAYTIQKPGNYKFEVKGANGDGIWNAKTTTLQIKVAPAPWRTWWAFTIYGFLILTALHFLITILKSKAALKHELNLEHIETERSKELNKTKLQFFTNISHEFRTPLALILGPLHQIIEEYKGSSAIYKKLLVIENSANHLLHLINRLMDFRKFESNLFKLEAAEGNIVKFLREIYLSFTEFAKNGAYNFEFESAFEHILVYYDRNKLERVFYNLISNAFRYTPKGGTITISIKKNSTEVVVEVSDSGVGVSEEYRDKIFERFFELSVNNKPDNKYNKGTGIGLSIAKNIVELHKGKLNYRANAAGKGSVFSVSLALGKSHLKPSEILSDFKFSDDLSQYVSQPEAVTLPLEENMAEIKDEDKPTLLLVEDNKDLRKFIKGLLVLNYNVLEAENGSIAFNIAKREPLDLIISDVIMPEMTGTELCAAIKGDLKTSHIPIVLLTSRSALIFKLEGLERGADDYISKPFNVKEFKLRVKNLLQSREKLKQKFRASDGLDAEEVLMSSYDEKLYKKALELVKKHIANEQFDIPYFCSELGVSRTMLFTKIKAWSGLTPNEFILHFRMKKAVQLLEQGKLNISQVSYQVGFKNPKYFSKCFQKKIGQTPSQYANQFSEKTDS